VALPPAPPYARPRKRSVLTIVIIIVCIALPIAGGVGAAALYERATTDHSGPATFYGEKRKYQVTVRHAAAWAQQSRPFKRELQSVDLWLKHKKTGTNVFCVAAVALDEKMTPLEYARYMSKLYASTYTSFVEHETETLKGGGVMLHLSGIENGIKIEMLNAVYLADGVLYSVLGATTQISFSSMRDEIEHVVWSFQPPPSDATPTTLPKPPFLIAAPEEPPREIGGKDLYAMTAEALAEKAEVAAGRGELGDAIAMQRASVSLGHPGRVQLARYYARNANADAAIYWLQWAAVDEGAPLAWVGGDEVKALFTDPRWPEVSIFLRDAARYWASQSERPTSIQVPRAYKKGTPIPVVIGLHGHGYEPSQIGGDSYQTLADSLSVAYVSAAATVRFGPKRFGWSEQIEEDARRIDTVLYEVEKQVTIAPGKVVLVGFSQGGLVALDVASRNPKTFAGAIAMSPASIRPLDLQPAPLENKRFMVLFGKDESVAGQSWAYVAALRAAGADTIRRASPGSVPTFPPDYGTAIAAWIRFILDGKPRPAE
jgi:phospholipase/carboxylesterase